MRYGIYRMTNKMYHNLTTYVNNKKVVRYRTKQQLIDEMNEHWGLAMEIKDIIIYENEDKDG